MASPLYRIILPTVLLAVAGCSVATSPDTVCGDGTMLVDELCVPVDGTVEDPGAIPGEGMETPVTDPPPGEGDPGPVEDPIGGGDPPPAGGGDPPPTGGAACDPTTGECEAWRDAILTAVADAQAMRCGRTPMVDDRIVMIAQGHADQNAEADVLDTSSGPDLFHAVYESGVDFVEMASAYGQTNEGPDHLIAQWQMNPATRQILETRCDYVLGAGVATSASGWSYATLLVAGLPR